MINFKGTKGKWLVFAYNQVICNDKNIADCENWGIDKTGKEQEYNAKLISCAPEMLEMLESIVQSFESDYVMLDGKIVDNPYEWLKEDYLKAKELIKKATE